MFENHVVSNQYKILTDRCNVSRTVIDIRLKSLTLRFAYTGSLFYWHQKFHVISFVRLLCSLFMIQRKWLPSWLTTRWQKLMNWGLNSLFDMSDDEDTLLCPSMCMHISPKVPGTSQASSSTIFCHDWNWFAVCKVTAPILQVTSPVLLHFVIFVICFNRLAVVYQFF